MAIEFWHFSRRNRQEFIEIDCIFEMPNGVELINTPGGNMVDTHLVSLEASADYQAHGQIL